MKKFPYAKGINYSGYRENQSPRESIYPNKTEIYEDLQLLEGEYYYLRLFDCSEHAHQVLELIRDNDLNFKVMMGLSLLAEENHKNHPFFVDYTKESLEQNKEENEQFIEEMINFANEFKDFVSAISIGNEVRSIWNSNRLPIERLVEIAKRIKEETGLPVTFCEEYQTWIKELSPLAKVVDFISLHTYPAWQGYDIDKGFDRAVENYQEVQKAYPDKYCIITETGWPTSTHGSRIKESVATIANQHTYVDQITKWAKDNDVLVYLFEAFDEPWKGGEDPREPEKNWGLYTVHRQLKE